MMKHTILLIGSGGRECALAWKLSQSEHLDKLFIAPGNAGTEAYGTTVEIAATDIHALTAFALENKVTLCIVGPDDPLALGVVDMFRANKIPVFGPTQRAAEIESSKAFAKQVMHDAHVPTASSRTITSYEEACEYVSTHTLPVVIKASGLALGKGVYICTTHEEAQTALTDIMLHKVHKDAGDTVVIEAFLEGHEISVHALCDEHTHHLFPPAQDHKRIGENNTGKNTGGMGTIAPVPWASSTLMQDIQTEVVIKTLSHLASIDRTFTGCLFPGLMITKTGPQTLEFNGRFGDPETQVYMRLLETDLVSLLYAAATNTLEHVQPVFKKGYAVNIVLASGGYPDAYEKGKQITGIESASNVEGVVVFHAGTAVRDGNIVTNGGRVLGVSAYAETLEEALARAYRAIEYISFEGMYYRKDIGLSSLALKTKAPEGA